MFNLIGPTQINADIFEGVLGLAFGELPEHGVPATRKALVSRTTYEEISYANIRPYRKV